MRAQRQPQRPRVFAPHALGALVLAPVLGISAAEAGDARASDFAAESSQSADPCALGSRGAPGLAPVTLFEGDVGSPARACPRSEAHVGATAGAILNQDAFIGALDGGLRLGGSFRYGEGEAFASAEVPRYRAVQGATLTSSNLSLGWASAGAAHRVFERRDLRVVASGRLSAPAGPGLHDRGYPIYGELGAAATWRVAPAIRVHGYAGGLAGATLGRGSAGWRSGAQLQLGATWSVERVDVVLGAGARAGYGAPLDSAELAPGVRAPVWREELSLEIGATIPVAGGTRTDFAGAVRATWRL